MLTVQLRDTAVDLGVKLGAFDLVDDGSVVCFIHGKDISALGTFKFSHIVRVCPYFVWLKILILSLRRRG
jgi:hypothetical protein